jgi:hypothetical protein
MAMAFSSPRLIATATLGANGRLTFTRVDDQPLTYFPKSEAGTDWTVFTVSRVNGSSTTYLNKDLLPAARGAPSSGTKQIGQIGFRWTSFNASFDQNWNDAWIAGATLTVEVLRGAMHCPVDRVTVSLAITLT